MKIIIRDCFTNRRKLEWYGPSSGEVKLHLLGKASTIEGATKHIKSIYGENTEVEYRPGWMRDEIVRNIVSTNE